MVATAVRPEHILMAATLRQRKVQQSSIDRVEIETGWHAWLVGIFSDYVTSGFAPYHEEYWDWVWSIDDEQDVAPFVAVWPRGFGKSTSTELACAMLAARRKRRYALYVCETQEQADDHVSNVAELLEADSLAGVYPDASNRKVGKYGNVRGWRRNRLRTASGFTIDALGLDTAARGVKLGKDRPDLIILDDIDGKLDSVATTTKKVTTITHTLFPAGSSQPAVLAVQNLVIPDGVFSQLADGRADFLADRIVSGPHPALINMVTEEQDGKTVIIDGIPTWEARPIPVLQAELNRIGLTAFRAEKQHDVEPPAGGMFDHLNYRHCLWSQLPEIVRTAVWVDPAVTDTDNSDSQGIQADGKAADGTIYRLYSWEGRTSPQDAMDRAILKAVELGADLVGVETDQGGDTWLSVYRESVAKLERTGRIRPGQRPGFTSDKAGAGHGPKVERAGRMLAAYERGEIVHVIGTHETLERALKRFPKSKPFDLVDAAYWAWQSFHSTASATDQSAFAPAIESRQDRARRHRRLQP